MPGTGELIPIILTVNGDVYRLHVEPQWTLAQVLREVLHLMGTKLHCDEGACGYCTVLLNGETNLSCMTLAAAVDGAEVVTIEGISDGRTLHPVQAAWIKEHGAQCGYCSTGFIMSAVALLNKNAKPSTDEIKEALSGNICRCGNYESIINSVKLASRIISGEISKESVLADVFSGKEE